MITWARFSDMDWMGMAGASRFADGTDPLVSYDVHVDGAEALAVFDANGITILVLNDEGEELGLFSLRGDGAARAVALLPADTTGAALVDVFGFTSEPLS